MILRLLTLVWLTVLMTTANAQPVKEHGALSVVGTQLVDQKGQPVVLRGMSFGWHCFWPRFYTEGSVSWLRKDWGINVVRAALGVEPGENSYLKRKQWSKEKITTVVDAAIREGIYVIIDWHSHNINLAEAKEFFREMAEKYGKYPNVIYEIFNEPDDETWAQVKDYSREIMNTIRAVDPDNIILVGSPHWDQDVHIVADDPIMGFSNIMYTLHYYAATHNKSLRDRGDYALSKGIPLFISESAGMEATGDGPIDPVEWKRWIEWAEANRISWVTWSVSDKDETCSVLLPTASSGGGWADKDMKPSGLAAREWIRKYNGWQGKSPLYIIAYYSGGVQAIDNYPVEKLSHIIYSFCHLKGNRLNVDDAADTATIQKLVSLKKRHPLLKIMLSLGGWGGCKTCSDVFASEAARQEFAVSVKELNDYFGTDGIDLDWEYPGIPGHPGHPWQPADRLNFTALVKALRQQLGSANEVSFAAGGFPQFLEEAVEWQALAPLIDRVNLMSYDLVSGFSTRTGHHTPLFSTPSQVPSANQAITWLDSAGFPLNKVVIGAAFYARSWEGVVSDNNGLYQDGKFKSFIAYKTFSQNLSREKGFTFYRDPVAQAPWAYNAAEKIFATFDDEASIRAKTKYAIDKGLNGIMFWELTLDAPEKGLLDEMYRVVSGK